MAWGKVKFYWNELLSSLVATSTAIGFDVINLLDRFEGTKWRATSTIDQYITYDAGEGNTYTADFLAISGHNLYSITATLGLQYSTGSTTGSDLVTNGAFTSDASGWTASAASLSSVGGGQSGNCLQVANSGAASGLGYQDITGLIVGETYKLSVYFKKGTGATGAIKIGTTTDDDAYGSNLAISDASWTEYTYIFTATETIARITLINESAVASETSLFDTVSLYIIDWTDAFTGYTPASDLSLIKEFTSQLKRLWRVEISGTPSAIAEMALCFWGELTELELVSGGLDPHGQIDKANVNMSHTGYVTGIHNRYIERSMSLIFEDADSTFYNKISAWWEQNGRKNFFISWEPVSHSTDIFLMRTKPEFKNPFVKGGLYRNITIELIGRKE